MPTHKHTATVLLAAFLVVVAVAPAALASPSETITEVDTNHDLATDAAIEEFQNGGSATGEVHGLNMTLTVADKAGDVGFSGWSTSSSGRTFLRIQYHEEIERTVRIFIPNEYFSPRIKEGLSPMESDGPQAGLEPTTNRTHTAVTIQLTGPTDAVYPVSSTRGFISGSRSGVGDLVKNATGINLPTFSRSSAEWHYMSSSQLANDNENTIPTQDATVQYDVDPSENSERWIPVRDCKDANQPVCTFDRGNGNQTLVLTNTEDPPQVRWRSESSIAGTTKAAWNDAVQGAQDQLGDFGDWFWSSDD